MNRLHQRFDISNDDYLYVLSTFVFEPIRWNARFGWREMVEQEKLAQFNYWREVGRRMNIHSIPDDYAAFERFNVDYEAQHFRFTEANRRVAASTRDMFLGWFLPRPLRRFGEPFVYAMMDDPLLDAFGFPRPSPSMRRFVEGLLKMRARLVRLLPERRRPRLPTVLKRPTYPKGYRIEDLGPDLQPPST